MTDERSGLASSTLDPLRAALRVRRTKWLRDTYEAMFPPAARGASAELRRFARRSQFGDTADRCSRRGAGRGKGVEEADVIMSGISGLPHNQNVFCLRCKSPNAVMSSDPTMRRRAFRRHWKVSWCLRRMLT